MSVVRGPEQAYVLATTDSKNERFSVTIWLILEARAWKIQAFTINMSTLGRLDGARMLEVARTEEKSGHEFNAWIFYNAAAQLSDRGPNVQMGSAQAMSAERAKAKPPSEIAGSPPWYWKDGQSAFKVMNVGAFSIAGKVYLSIDHEVPAPTSDEDMEQSNKDLIAYFKRLRPEYAGIFAGLLVRAHQQGTGRGYATVDDGSGRNEANKGVDAKK